ncbi:MAG: chromate transporter [Bacteroidales bacterium]|nr:chromate transporter [Bacteroidales bacterium]
MSAYFKLILAYLKIGLFGFGGGYAMLSLIQREVVGAGWITNTMFTDIVAISQMTPGPIGINSATYIGYVVGSDAGSMGWISGIFGSILATMAVVIPPYILTLYTGHYINRHKDSPFIKGIFKGLRPVCVGLIGSAVLLLINKDNFGSTNYELTASSIICVISFLIVYFTKIHPILVIILAGIAGLIIY